jgi:hypothetical protein
MNDKQNVMTLPLGTKVSAGGKSSPYEVAGKSLPSVKGTTYAGVKAPIIKVGNNAELCYDLTLKEMGSSSYGIYVDNYNTLPELDNTNNKFMIDITVSDAMIVPGAVSAQVTVLDSVYKSDQDPTGSALPSAYVVMYRLAKQGQGGYAAKTSEVKAVAPATPPAANQEAGNPFAAFTVEQNEIVYFEGYKTKANAEIAKAKKGVLPSGQTVYLQSVTSFGNALCEATLDASGKYVTDKTKCTALVFVGWKDLPDLPDLVITGHTFNGVKGAKLSKSDNAETLCFTVQNKGQVADKNFDTSYIDVANVFGSNLEKGTLDAVLLAKGLAKGTSKDLCYNFWFVNKPKVAYTFEVDSSKNVVEIDETNNKYTVESDYVPR